VNDWAQLRVRMPYLVVQPSTQVIFARRLCTRFRLLMIHAADD
jgi:hypothetical protein